MIVGLASDHRGFEKKAKLIKYLEKKGLEVKDFGTNSSESCDFPDYSNLLCDAIINEEVNFIEFNEKYEIAKKVGVTSKEAVERAKELGIEVKSHLSTLEESDAKKIEESFGKVKKEKKESKESTEKTSGPVIIRRQVIMNEEEPKAKPKQEQTHKKGVGFVENDRKKDYNIVYRNRPTKPMSVSDLFGIPKKEEPKKEEKPQTKVEVGEEVKKEEPKKQEKPQTKEVIEDVKKVEESVEKKENNMKQETNNNYNTKYRNYNRITKCFSIDFYCILIFLFHCISNLLF